MVSRPQPASTDFGSVHSSGVITVSLDWRENLTGVCEKVLRLKQCVQGLVAQGFLAGRLGGGKPQVVERVK
jgi:hypothetical protein